MPNIGLPVTQPHLPPGSQSPSHHLALLPGPVLEMAVLSLMKSRVRIEMGDSLGFLKMRENASFATSARGRVDSRLLDTWIPVIDDPCRFLHKYCCGNSYTGDVR